MEITINLMTVLYVVLAYLAVGFIVILAYNVIELKDNKRMLSEDEFKKNIFKSLYRSLIFSWAFPYLLYTEIPERVMRTGNLWATKISSGPMLSTQKNTLMTTTSARKKTCINTRRKPTQQRSELHTREPHPMIWVGFSY